MKKPGTRVRHKKFGEATVLAIDRTLHPMWPDDIMLIKLDNPPSNHSTNVIVDEEALEEI